MGVTVILGGSVVTTTLRLLRLAVDRVLPTFEPRT
jgi:hypothetical protein